MFETGEPQIEVVCAGMEQFSSVLSGKLSVDWCTQKELNL